MTQTDEIYAAEDLLNEASLAMESLNPAHPALAAFDRYLVLDGEPTDEQYQIDLLELLALFSACGGRAVHPQPEFATSC